jgi:phospholipase C
VPPGAVYHDPFATTGVRVPAIIASPFVQSGTCYNGTLDHTSILQMFAEKFGGNRRGYSDDVNRHLDQGIESVSSALSSQRRQDVPVAPTTPVPALLMLRATKPLITENQKAFLGAAQRLMAYDRARAIR